jgi:hypothetical protein
MPNSLTFVVYGLPAPQGSKRSLGNGILVESSKAVRPWRQDVKHAALACIPPGWDTTLPMSLSSTTPQAVTVTSLNSSAQLKTP